MYTCTQLNYTVSLSSYVFIVFVFQIGTDELTREELVENIGKLCVALHKKFPGGWSNIAKLSIGALGVPPLVIHFSKSKFWKLSLIIIIDIYSMH